MIAQIASDFGTPLAEALGVVVVFYKPLVISPTFEMTRGLAFCGNDNLADPILNPITHTLASAKRDNEVNDGERMLVDLHQAYSLLLQPETTQS